MILFFKRKSIAVFFAVLAVLLLFSVSCSRTKPEITYGFMQLVLYQGDPRPVEHFSFFIFPKDEDGIENLEELYLYHDREQLRWHIKNDEWITYVQDGNTWIGTRSIAVQEGLSLPRGQYRAVLINKGGEKGERNFTFDAEVRFPFPELDIGEGRYVINSRWPNNRLICYDNQGNYVSTITPESITGSVTQLNLPSSVRSVALWAEDPAYFCSALTNVISTR